MSGVVFNQSLVVVAGLLFRALRKQYGTAVFQIDVLLSRGRLLNVVAAASDAHSLCC